MGFRDMLIEMTVNDNLLRQGFLNDDKVRVENQRLISEYIQSLDRRLENET